MIDVFIEMFDNMSHYEQAAFSWLLAMYTANFKKKLNWQYFVRLLV